VLRGVFGSNLDWNQTTLTKVLCSQYLKVNAPVLSKMGHKCFFSDCLQFVLHCYLNIQLNKVSPTDRFIKCGTNKKATCSNVSLHVVMYVKEL